MRTTTDVQRTERARRRVLQGRPWLPITLAAVATLFFALPLIGLVWRAPWTSFWSAITTDAALAALGISLVTSLGATVLGLFFGLPLAWVQANVDYRGKAVVRALTTLPMVLPPVVGGTALLYAFGRLGLFGRYLDDVDIRLAFTTAGAVVAATFVAMPFLVLTMEAAFRSVDPRMVEASRSLGASRWVTFLRVVLPIVRPSIVAGAVLCWARALGEFGATITFAGNLSGTTQTLPLYIFTSLQGSSPDTAIALSLVLVAISLIILVSLRGHWLGRS